MWFFVYISQVECVQFLFNGILKQKKEHALGELLNCDNDAESESFPYPHDFADI